MHVACIETSINPKSKIGILLTGGQNFGAAHLFCTNADIICNAANVNDIGNVALARMLVVAELTEVFMPQLTALPDCDQHTVGEGLSVAMAFNLYPAGITTSATVENTPAYYLNTKVDSTGAFSSTGTARGDWVNVNPAGEGTNQLPAIGCATLFFGYLTSQLGYTFTQICTALNSLPAYSTCRALYNKLANNTTDPFPDFIDRLNRHYPMPSHLDNHFTQNPFPLT